MPRAAAARRGHAVRGEVVAMRVVRPGGAQRPDPALARQPRDRGRGRTQGPSLQRRLRVAHPEEAHPVGGQAQRHRRPPRLVLAHRPQPRRREGQGARVRRAAVGDHHQVDVDLPETGLGDQAAAAQTLVVGMRRKHHDGLAACHPVQVRERQRLEGAKHLRGRNHRPDEAQEAAWEGAHDRRLPAGPRLAQPGTGWRNRSPASAAVLMDRSGLGASTVRPGASLVHQVGGDPVSGGGVYARHGRLRPPSGDHPRVPQRAPEHAASWNPACLDNLPGRGRTGINRPALAIDPDTV